MGNFMYHDVAVDHSVVVITGITVANFLFVNIEFRIIATERECTKTKFLTRLTEAEIIRFSLV